MFRPGHIMSHTSADSIFYVRPMHERQGDQIWQNFATLAQR